MGETTPTTMSKVKGTTTFGTDDDESSDDTGTD